MIVVRKFFKDYRILFDIKNSIDLDPILARFYLTIIPADSGFVSYSLVIRALEAVPLSFENTTRRFLRVVIITAKNSAESDCRANQRSNGRSLRKDPSPYMRRKSSGKLFDIVAERVSAISMVCQSKQSFQTVRQLVAVRERRTVN
jgi:hypothetical protein